MEALHGFDEGGLDHMDSYLGSDEEGLCGSGGYGGMAGLASFNALGLDDMRDDVGLLDSKRGKVGAARLLWLRPAGCFAARGALLPGRAACDDGSACSLVPRQQWPANHLSGKDCLTTPAPSP